MKNVFLLNYSIQGIKTLDQPVTLSFYKKTITKQMDTRQYNIKGIYGMNGAGKSGIVSSVEILKNLIINPLYLSNPIVQKNLDALINKKTKELRLKADFVVELEDVLQMFHYEILLAQDSLGKYVIKKEILSQKRATSRTEQMNVVFSIEKGEIVALLKKGGDILSEIIRRKSINLLSSISLPALFFGNILMDERTDLKELDGLLLDYLCELYFFGQNLHVYMDQADDHTDYLVNTILINKEKIDGENSRIEKLLNSIRKMKKEHINIFSTGSNVVKKAEFSHFEDYVQKLFEFLSIFKTDLKGIEIEKRENADSYICTLLMVYEQYRIDAEFESTGIKKLIQLYSYLREMNQGGIVFIDEFDSNLHDVYLCALLEYLMEYGEGQLCFTTHNVGPMDILKQNKNSIDFLSMDHKIYPWKTNGNYSPSNLYRKGMIEGSPFNIESIDFIGVFDDEVEA